MTTRLEEPAPEEGTYVIQLSFFDEDGDAATPNVATWTLTDGKGAVVNGREAVSITPAQVVNVVLRGDDLALGGDYFGRARKLLVSWTYDSDLGDDLPMNEEVTFRIDDFVKVT